MLSGLIFAAAGIRICLVFKAQGAGGVMVLGISFWLLSTIWASFKYHSLPAYLLLNMSIPLYRKCPHLVIAAYSWTTQHVTKHNVISNCFFFWKWQWVQFTPQSPDRNSVEHLWDVVEWKTHICRYWVFPANVESIIWRMEAVLMLKGDSAKVLHYVPNEVTN